jgi:N-acetylmuramoyl-L-alanine amidase
MVFLPSIGALAKFMNSTMLRIFFVVGLTLFFSPHISSAQSKENLKADYFKLKNTDPNLKKPEKWLMLIRRHQVFLKKENDPELLFHLANLYIISQPENKEEALLYLEKLSRDFPTSSLADDSLLKMAEIYEELDKQEMSREMLLRVVKNYPNGDQYIVAKNKLLRQGKSEDENRENKDKVREEKADIVLDPGHGGDDLGAVGVGGLLEKDVVLAVALMAEKIIEEKSDYNVALTRRSDRFVPLAERTEFANRMQAKLFISLHTNASITKKLSGLEIYYLDNTDDHAGKLLAERENRDGEELGDLQLILGDLIQSSKLPDSVRLANILHDSIQKHIQALGTKTHGVKKAPFYVLVGSHAPCILAELLFIDHPKDGKLLSEKSFRDLLARGIADGALTFLEGKKF